MWHGVLVRGENDVSVDDTALVRRCLENQADSMRHLIERFQTDVFGLCVRMLNHRQDAEDVVQEVFVRVFRSLRKWDSSRPLKPWIMTIAANRCRTLMSQRVRRPELVDYLNDTPGRDQRDDSIELVAEMQAAIRDLRPDYRLAFVMFHEQGQSYEEIGLTLERPVGTVKTWLHRARLEVLDRLRQRGMLSDADLSVKPPQDL